MNSIPSSRKVAQYSKHGSSSSVLEYTTGPVPSIVKGDQVLVKVSAAGLNPVDYKVMRGDLSLMLRIAFPGVPGLDFSGTIAAVGDAVTGFEVGDAVYGRVASIGAGTCAEYILVSTKSDFIKPKPPTISFTEAASVGTCAGTAAAMLLTHCKLNSIGSSGSKVLVIGASGGVGTWTVQAAKHLGAHVTAICSAKNVSYVQYTLKADRIVDYTAGPLASQLNKPNEFDAILDCVGGDAYWTLAQTILKPGGHFVTAVGQKEHGGGGVTGGAVASMLGSMAWRTLTNTRKYSFVTSLPADAFEAAHMWVSGGHIKPLVNTVFPLSEVAQAFAQLETHRTVGKIVVTVA